MSLTEGTLIVGRFRILESLGADLYGDAYLAWDIGRQYEMELKQLHAEIVRENGGIEGITPFLTTLTRLHHPHIAGLFDFHVDRQGQIFLCEEMIQGTPLNTLLTVPNRAISNNRVDLGNLIADAVDALDYGSEISPHLSLNSKTLWLEEDGEIKIKGWGLAKLVSPDQFRNVAHFERTDHYLAPEYSDGDTVQPDDKSDQFALGILINELRQALLTEKSRAHDLRHQALQQRLTAVNRSERFGNWTEVKSALDNERPLPRSRSRQKRFVPTNRKSIIRSAGMGILCVAIFVALILLKNSNLIPKQQDLELADIDTRLNELDSRYETLVRTASADTDVLNRVLSDFPMSQSASLFQLRSEIEWQASEPAVAERTVGTLRFELSRSITRLESAIQSIAFLKQLNDLDQKIERLHAIIPPHFLAERDAESQTQDIVKGVLAGHYLEAQQKGVTAVDSRNAQLAQLQDLLLNEARKLQIEFHRILNAKGLPIPRHHRKPGIKLEDGKAAFATGNIIAGAHLTMEAYETYNHWLQEFTSIPSAESHHRVNSLGMRFIQVGELWVSIWETRLYEFAVYAGQSGADTRRLWRRNSHPRAWTHPVVNVGRYDAREFCRWLTKTEQATGQLATNETYRLPTDEEWSLFVGLPAEDGHYPEERGWADLEIYPWGPQPFRTANSGNYNTWPDTSRRSNELMDPWLRTAPAGQFRPNKLGLYDLGGNVWEFVSDNFADTASEENKTIRGGSWRSLSLEAMRSNHRRNVRHDHDDVGFRIVLDSASASLMKQANR